MYKLIALEEIYSRKQVKRNAIGFIRCDGDFDKLAYNIYRSLEQQNELISCSYGPLTRFGNELGLVYKLTSNVIVVVDPVTNEPDDYYRQLIIILCDVEFELNRDAQGLSESVSSAAVSDCSFGDYSRLSVKEFMTLVYSRFYGIHEDEVRTVDDAFYTR